MFGAIANVMAAIWNFIPADVWIWGSIIICILLKIAGEKASLWFGFLISCFGLYFFLTIADAIAPDWLELFGLVIFVFVIVKRLFWR